MGSLLPESFDVAAGLVFVYLLMSVLATIGREALEGFLKSRSKHLEKGLIELLCDHPPEKEEKGAGRYAGYDMLKRFYDHPLIMSLYRGRYTIPPKRKFEQGKKLPSYIPSSHFAYVVLDMLAENGGQRAGHLDADTIAAAADTLNNRRLAKMVQFAVHNSGGDIDMARQFLENWFNATMDRVSGWYRLETQTILFWLSLVACVVLNVNTVVIADTLYRSPSLRHTVETQAESYYRAHPDAIAQLPSAAVTAVDVSTPAGAATNTPQTVMGPIDPLTKLGLPLGWNSQTLETMHRLFPQVPRVDQADMKAYTPVKLGTKGVLLWAGNVLTSIKCLWLGTIDAYSGDGQDIAKSALFGLAGTISLVLGWVMTAFAVTLGAPFWFDVLGKLMMIRSTLKPGADGKGGSFNPDSLRTLTTALTSPPAGAPRPVLMPYMPGNAASAISQPALLAAPAGPGGDDTLDPSLRPRDD